MKCIYAFRLSLVAGLRWLTKEDSSAPVMQTTKRLTLERFQQMCYNNRSYIPKSCKNSHLKNFQNEVYKCFSTNKWRNSGSKSFSFTLSHTSTFRNAKNTKMHPWPSFSTTAPLCFTPNFFSLLALFCLPILFCEMTDCDWMSTCDRLCSDLMWELKISTLHNISTIVLIYIFNIFHARHLLLTIWACHLASEYRQWPLIERYINEYRGAILWRNLPEK